MRGQKGFSLFELIIVVVLIGILAATSIKYFIDAMAQARATSVEMTAWRFAQSAAVLRAWSSIPADIEPHNHGVDRRGVSWVMLEGTRIYLNENGWPANADGMMSPAIGDQTEQECEQLLHALLKQPITYTGEQNTKYTIFAVDGRTCRYQLARNRDEDAWFFDYSLESGKVQVSVPKLKMEQYANN